MNAATPDPPPTPRPSARHRFPRWLLWGGVFISLIGIFYGEEDWRGRRDWNQYRAASEARGESLNLKSYLPKLVPDDQNFCATPFLKSFFQTNDNGFLPRNDPWLLAEVRVKQNNNDSDHGHRRYTDLAAWQQAFAALQNGPFKGGQYFETTNTSLAARSAAAPAVLDGMKPYEAEFAELRAASTRPFSICPVTYDVENPWPILARYFEGAKVLCQRLSLEASAELAAGQTDQALANVKLSFALADSLKSEPFLISHLVRVACLQIAIQPVWDGLAEHRWTESQLQELQARFLACDFVADLDQTRKEAQADEIIRCDHIQQKGLATLADTWSPVSSNDPRPPRKLFKWIGWVMPSGWYDLEKVNFCRAYEKEFTDAVDFAGKKALSVEPPIYASEALDGFRASAILKAALHHRLIAEMLSHFGAVKLTAVARPQTTANQAAIACALERYRLANGQFPDKLEALAPQFISRLPNDVLTGQPYKYRRTDDGLFVLYSVGWNEKDDGGVPGERLFDDKQGDWVWDYPAR